MEKILTRYLIAFSASASILTVIFRYFLSSGISKNSIVQVAISAVLYACAMYWIGYLFGRKEHLYTPWHDIGFRWNLSSFIVHMAVSFTWFQYGFNSPYESINVIYSYGIIWGVLVLCHYLVYNSYRKSTLGKVNKVEHF